MAAKSKTDLLRQASPPRTAKLFTNGRNQAVRLPREFEFRGTQEVSIYRVGTRLVIEPARRSWLDLAQVPAAGDDFLAKRPRLVSTDRRVRY